MRPDRIRKDIATLRVPPHLADWPAARSAFSWTEARRALAGLPDGALNIAHEAVERHAHGPRAGQVAIHWLGADGDALHLTYAGLSMLTNCVANALLGLGLERGDRLFLLLPRIPELYIAVLGALKAGIVVAPLFSAFGPEPIATRINLGSGRALLTTRALFERKVAPETQYFIVLDCGAHVARYQCVDCFSEFFDVVERSGSENVVTAVPYVVSRARRD